MHNPEGTGIHTHLQHSTVRNGKLPLHACLWQTVVTVTHRYCRGSSVTGGLGLCSIPLLRLCSIPLLLCRIGGGLRLGGRVLSRSAVARLCRRGSVTSSSSPVTSLCCRGTTIASLRRGPAVTGRSGSVASWGGSVTSGSGSIAGRGTPIAAALCGRLLVAGGLRKEGSGSGASGQHLLLTKGPPLRFDLTGQQSNQAPTCF